jgi:hypothetical protein
VWSVLLVVRQPEVVRTGASSRRSFLSMFQPNASIPLLSQKPMPCTQKVAAADPLDPDLEYPQMTR